MAKNGRRNSGRPNADGNRGQVPNYLKARKRKALARQARRTVNSAYRPDLQALGRQRKREGAIWQKRRADLKYYKKWLDQRQKEWDTNAAAADKLMQDNISASNQRVLAGFDQLQTDTVKGAEKGVSSAKDYKGFDFTIPGGLAAAQGEAFAKYAAQLTQNSGTTREALQANSRNSQAARAATAASEHWNRVQEIGDTRQRLLSERRKDRIAEHGRLLDVEIEKAKVRADIRLKRKELQLRNKAINVDNSNADANRAAKQKSEKGEKGEKDGKGDAVNRRARKKLSREYTSEINGGIQAIASDPAFAGLPPKNARWTSDERAKLKKRLVNGGIVRRSLVQATLDVYFTGGLRQSTKRSLKSQGYIVPKIWR